MKHNRILRTLLCLMLLAFVVVAMAACPSTGPDDPTPDPGPTPTPTPDPTPIDGGGSNIKDDDFVMRDPEINREGAIEITGRELLGLFRNDTVEAGKTYLVTSQAHFLNADRLTYNGHGATFIFEDGLLIEGCRSTTVTDMVIAGSVSVVHSQNMIFEGVALKGNGDVCFSLDDTCAGFVLNGCRLSGTATALVTNAKNTAVLNSYLSFTVRGVDDRSAEGLTVRNCILKGESGDAIVSNASEVDLRNNSITVAPSGVGISLTAKAGTKMLNNLVALNNVKGTERAIVIDGAVNTSVILNTVTSIHVTNGHSLYVCSNIIGGKLNAADVDYLLADENQYEGQVDHSPVLTNVTHKSGDTIMDINARPEYGANEDLLPQVDRELFVGMDVKYKVKDVTAEESEWKSLAEYIVAQSGKAGRQRVIIAPGKYNSAESYMNLSGEAYDDTTVYAYGVYAEKDNTGSFAYFQSVDNYEFRGITFASKITSCGQMYVLDKLSGNRLLVAKAAGFTSEMTSSGMGAQRAGTFYAYCDTSFNSLTDYSDNDADYGRLYIMNVSAYNYTRFKVGDVVTSRIGGSTSIPIYNSTGVVFRDVTVYGNAGGFAFVEGGNESATTYYRLLDTTRTGEIIDEETYNYYKALEQKYFTDKGINASLEISVDELGRYRGSLPHIGSIDATHTTKCAQGSIAKFCLFENMCDDGTNQNAGHARLRDFVINEEAGTVDLYYSGNLSVFSHQNNGRSLSGYCHPFRKGDRVYIYTSSGQLVCDGPALEAVEQILNEKGGTVIGEAQIDDSNKASYELFKVSVALEHFNVDALYTQGIVEGGDGSGSNIANPVRYIDKLGDAIIGGDAAEAGGSADSRYTNNYKVLVDNMSMSSNGFLFENTMIRNIRSRGLLIKASNAKIDHCTFNNVGMGGVAILYEIYWGESGVTENLDVTNNLFDHTGYFNSTPRYSPVAIEGLGTRADDDYLLYTNITIKHNKMINRESSYAIYVNSAKNVTIEDNYIGIRISNGAIYNEGDKDNNGNDFYRYSDNSELVDEFYVICILGAKDVKIENNYYEHIELGLTDNSTSKQDQVLTMVVANNFRHIYGSDVSDENGNPYLDDDYDG